MFRNIRQVLRTACSHFTFYSKYYWVHELSICVLYLSLIRCKDKWASIPGVFLLVQFFITDVLLYLETF